MTHTCGVCGGFWVIFLCGDTIFPFNLFRGRDSLIYALGQPLLILQNIDHVSLRREIIPNFSLTWQVAQGEMNSCMNGRTHIHPA